MDSSSDEQMYSARSVASDSAIAAPQLNPSDHSSDSPFGKREIKEIELVMLWRDMELKSKTLIDDYPHIFSKEFPLDPLHPIYTQALESIRILSGLRRTVHFDSPEYFAFWTICQQTPDNNIMTPAAFAVARVAFECAYGNEDAVVLYMKFIAFQLYEWSAPSNLYYAMYHSVVNGSLMGKTRLLTEFAKKMCLQFYLNVSWTSDVYPNPSKTIRDWILSNCDPKLSRADLNTQSLLLGCATMLEYWLTDQQGKFNHHGELFEAWHKKQDIVHEINNNLFWAEVLVHQKQQACRLEVDARIKGIIRHSNLTAEEKKVYAHIASELLNDPVINPTVAPPGIDPNLWSKSMPGSNMFSDGLILSFPSLIEKQTRNIDRMLWSPGFTKHTGFVKFRTELLKSWGLESYCWPTLMIVIDEARTLITQNPGASIFQIWRNAARFFPKKKNPSLLLVVTDTNSRISNFAPTGDVEPSSRTCLVDAAYSGRKLFPPFHRIRSIDAFDFEPKLLGEVVKISGYAKYGRAALGAFLQQQASPGSELIALLQRKLVKVRSGMEFDDAASVAILYFLICFAVQSYSPLAQELVASHMMRCTGISTSRYQILLLAVPEPAMAVAARMVLETTGWGPIIQRICKRGITDIDIGAHGEVAAQLLLIMASFQAEKKGETAEFARDLDIKDEFPILPISLFAILETLGMKSHYIHPDYWRIIETWKTRLLRAYVRLAQFTKSNGHFTPEYLKGRFARANGVMCQPGYPGIDGLLPILIVDKPFDSYDAVKATPLDSKLFSHVGLQFKNLQQPESLSKYRSWATTDMRAARVLGNGAPFRNEDLFHVSLVIDVGPSKEGDPEFLVFENEQRKQLSIVIRGLRPRHVLEARSVPEPLVACEQSAKLKARKDAEDLELYFDVLRSGPAEPSDGSRDVAEAGDVYGPDLDDLLMEQADDYTVKLMARGDLAVDHLRATQAVGHDAKRVDEAIKEYVKSRVIDGSKQHALYCAVCDMEELLTSIGWRAPKRICTGESK